MIKGNILHSELNLSGNEEEEFHKWETVPQYILSRINHPDTHQRPCITNGVTGESLKYCDVEPISRKIASFFHKRGLTKGGIVIYTSSEVINLHVLFLGIWRANGVVRAFYPEDLPDLLIEKIKESDCKWIVCDSSNVSNLHSAFMKARVDVIIIVFGKYPDCISFNDILNEASDDDCPKMEISKESLALILPTSGTTGKSKGAIYNHSSLLRNIVIYEKIEMSENIEDGILLTGKQTHFTGSVCPLACLARRRNLFMLPGANKENIFNCVVNYQIRGIFSFPKFILDLLDDLEGFDDASRRIEYVGTSGCNISPSFNGKLQAHLPNLKSFTIIYGMTEAGLLSAFRTSSVTRNGNEASEIPEFSCGKLVPGTLLKVMDPETGETLRPELKGELCFKSELICNEYFKNSEATLKTFNDGWIHSGDLGYFDQQGFIYIVDRIKEIFKYFNNHICPGEIENILLQHPYVKDACVIGIPDPEGGDTIPRAFVTLNKDTSVQEDIKTISCAIEQFANNQLASYKRLRGGLFILDSFPKGKTGKVVKNMFNDIPLHY